MLAFIPYASQQTDITSSCNVKWQRSTATVKLAKSHTQRWNAQRLGLAPITKLAGLPLVSFSCISVNFSLTGLPFWNKSWLQPFLNSEYLKIHAAGFFLHCAPDSYKTSHETLPVNKIVNTKCKYNIYATYLDLHLNTTINKMLWINPVIWRCQLSSFQMAKVIHLQWDSRHVGPTATSLTK